MITKFKKLINPLFILILSFSCTAKKDNPEMKKDVKQFNDYIEKGNNIFANKNGIDNFASSIRCYDSARLIAEKYENDSLKYEAYYYTAIAYDGWNKEPKNTVYYYSKASEFAHKLANKDDAAYASILVAHALMKNYDSAGAVDECKRIDLEEMKFVEPQNLDDYYTELAYICVSRRSYPLAYKFSLKVKHPERIKNSYLSFKTYQCITQTSLHLYYLHTEMNAWIDTVKSVISTTHNLSDSLSNYVYLVESYRYLKQQDSLKKYEQIVDALDKRFGNSSAQEKAKNAFLEYQIKETEREKTSAILEKKSILNTSIAIGIVAVLSIFVTLFVWMNRKKMAERNKELAELNNKLKDKSEENEQLLKEMHHRVKNNLSLVYSLLEMQGRKTDNEETKTQLMIAKGRIESIAMTHEQLYKNQNELLNMYDYLTIIINSSIHSCGGTKQIRPTIDIDKSLELKPEKCLPLAMLINEMITNTAKYASTNEDCIYISIKGDIENNTITILYADSGEINIDSEFKEGFGSKIIKILSKQLHANLETHFNNIPFNYCIKFSA